MRRLSYVFLALLAQAFAPLRAARHEPEAWRLQTEHDGFSGQTLCTLGTRDGVIFYQPGAIGFRFAHRRDTLAAWYQVDGGAPVRWENRYAALVAAGVQIDGAGLDNPTGGIVWIPQAELSAARTISIRLTGKDRPRRFDLSPITPFLAEAAQQGCRFPDIGHR